MAQTIEQRVRSAYGAEGDDFFRTEGIIDRVNDAYLKTVSILASIEKEMGNPLRSLDKLRFRKNIQIDQIVQQENKYEVVSVVIPDSVHEFLYLSFFDSSLKKTVPMDELSTKKLMMLEIGNAIPTKAEMYYHRVNESGTSSSTPLINVYGYELVSGEDDIRLYYIKKPETIIEGNEQLPSLPRYLEQAVIMETCASMAIKDSDESKNPDVFEKKFQSEIKNNGI